MRPVEVVQDNIHQHLYRIKYDDGAVSDEMYNKSRAVDVLHQYDWKVEQMKKSDRASTKNIPLAQPEKATGALKSREGTPVSLPEK